MGNAQSHGQPHNRLVKPKTNTNSPPLAPDNDLHVDSPMSLSSLSSPSKYASLSARDRQQIKSQLLSPVQTDFGYRESLDGEENLGEIASNVQRLSSRSNSLSCFGSKTSSTTRLSSLPASKVSLVQSNQPIDLETAISILQEVQKNASPEDIAALQQALQPYASSPSPRPSTVTEPGLGRRTSVVNRSTSSLTRRRSLLATPGVATRNSPVESNRRTWNSWRTPQLDPQDEARWQHQEAATSSPLTRTAALDLAEEGRESPTRARTPAEMEYSHLGSLKLGSLRIANGEPSPDASTKLNWYASQATSQGEDYFSPEALDSPIMMKPTRKRRHVRSKSALQPPTPPLYRNLRVSDDARKAKTTSRYGTPSRLETPEQPPQQREQHSLQYAELDMEPEPVRRLRVMNKSQDTLATMLDSRPEVTDDLEPTQPVLAEYHDEGFASDDGRPFRDEAIRILDGTMFGEPTELSMSQVSVVHSISTTPKNQQQTDKRPPPKKADSGYSSGGSFKTKHREAWKPGTIPTVSKKPSMATDLRQRENGSEEDDATSLYTFEQMLQYSTSQDSLPPASTDEYVTSHFIHRYRSQEDFKNSFVLQQSLPVDWNIDDLSLGLKAPKTPKTPTSFISQFSIDSKTSTKKRLQKRVPSFQELPVVQSCDPIPEGSIPGIPTDVRKQFVRRLSEAPGMECLTHTYPTKNHVNREEPEPELPVLEPIRFPSPPATPEPESRGRHHKRGNTERSSSLRGFGRSLSLFRRKSKAEKQQPPLPNEPNVLDLGTTASSLGRSPYDAALATVHQKRITSPAHPHQLGDTMPRAKSMVNMDAQTAAQLARLRSQDRPLLRPEMPSRPKSYYSEREATGAYDAYRRHSFYGHAHPIPTMPTIRSIGELGVASRLIEPLPVEQLPTTETNSAPTFRARSTGRGRVVTPLIEKYNRYGQRMNEDRNQSRSYTMDENTAYQQLNQAAAESGGRSYSMGSRLHSFSNKQVNHLDWG